MRSPKFLLAVIVLSLCAGNLWFTLVRSTIPLNLDGRVESIDILTEKHPGLDDVYIARVGDKSIHIDEAVARNLREGDSIRKDAWSERIKNTTDPKRSIELSTSEDFRGMLAVMPTVVVIVGVILIARRQRILD